MMKFPVQILKHVLYENGKEAKVSFDISIAGTTVESVSLDEAEQLTNMLQNLVQVEKKEVSHE